MPTHDHPNTAHDRSRADLVRVLGQPDDVLSHPDLTTTEKREILAGWASDAHAVVDAPGLRQLDSGAIVGLDEVLRALRALDDGGGRPSKAPTSKGPTPSEGPTSKMSTPGFERRRRPSLARLLVSLRSRDDDDDDPPPSPAAALPLDLAAARRRKWEPNDTAEPVAA